MLFRLPVDTVNINESSNCAYQILGFEGFSVKLVEARPLRASTDVDVVLVLEATNQADPSCGRT
jgi:hypothetical protein